MNPSPENPNLNDQNEKLKLKEETPSGLNEKLVFNKPEVLWDGDVYRFSGDMDTLLKIAEKISAAVVDGSPETKQIEIKRILEVLKNNEEYRIDGNTLALKIYNGKLVFDNRNARGNVEYRKQMKSIVDGL